MVLFACDLEPWRTKSVAKPRFFCFAVSFAYPEAHGLFAGQKPPSAALAADKTSVVSAAKTSVVQAAKKAATSDISMGSTTPRGRLRRPRGVVDEIELTELLKDNIDTAEIMVALESIESASGGAGSTQSVKTYVTANIDLPGDSGEGGGEVKRADAVKTVKATILDTVGQVLDLIPSSDTKPTVLDVSLVQMMKDEDEGDEDNMEEEDGTSTGICLRTVISFNRKKVGRS